MMVEFTCPHCGYGMKAPAHMDGETHPCLSCNRPVTLQVVSTKDALKAGIVAGTVAVLAEILFGDN
jgi:hypothetical protein